MLSVAAILMCLPYPMLMISGLALFTTVFLSCYFYRWQWRNDAVMKPHIKNVCRLIWQSTFLLFIGIILFGCIVYFNGDTSPIHTLAERAQRGVIASEADIAAMQIAFIELNKSLIVITAIMCLLPYPLFILIKSFLNVRGFVKKGAK
jgi:hypothetical protein